MNGNAYVRKIILTAIALAILLLLILIPSSSVNGWLNKGRYQNLSYGKPYAIVLDTATWKLTPNKIPPIQKMIYKPAPAAK